MCLTEQYNEIFFACCNRWAYIGSHIDLYTYKRACMCINV